MIDIGLFDVDMGQISEFQGPGMRSSATGARHRREPAPDADRFAMVAIGDPLQPGARRALDRGVLPGLRVEAGEGLRDEQGPSDQADA